MTGRNLRTLVVGIDAACEGVLDPMFERGLLPNLRSLVESGVAGPLESQVPPWTPSAWPSLFTGTNPGKHGAYSFLRYEGYDWDVLDATDVEEPALWDILDARGLSSVVVNVPVTAPPSAIDGAIVPGFTAPEAPPCHPDGLLADVEDAIGEYRVYSREEFNSRASPTTRHVEYMKLVRMRGKAFRYLCERFDPDFGFVQFQQSDTVVHDMPGDLDELRVVYQAIDMQLGRILEECDPDTVFVVSDHGIGPYAGQEFRVNAFLRDRGYLETTRSGQGRPSWVPIFHDRLSGDEGDDDRPLAARTLDRGMAVAGRAGVTPDRLVALLSRVGLDDAVTRLLPASLVQAAAGEEQVDFAASRAYMRLPVELGVRINLEGREPEGVVPPERYEALREELIDLLSSVRTPAGDPVFERVVPREEVFSGPNLEDAVDVVTIPANYDQFPSARLGADHFGPPNEPWNHKRDGILVAAGAGVDTAADVDGAHLLDVAPTVLASLGVPASDRMDGRVLDPVAPVGEATYPRPGPREDRTGDTGYSVENRLADLGYLE
ncbi:alkaline phosphatase family protein [Halomarina ordinaria]|uniref:Alkaline phosphatase family protein n=1 Tax=Halomarina ordinaria TaxID=3033939 RepID=A0ABD5UHY5_9EURY|nr:alkaline phosphatase family protein [Halomarina sp. PSRA2]